MRNLLYVWPAAILVLAFSALPSQAGYLTTSANWNAVSTVNMSKNAAISAVGKCKNVQTYRNLAGKTSGATIVAGPHTTPTDSKLHLTVRLYKNGKHDKSCHVYTGKNNAFASCNCIYND